MRYLFIALVAAALALALGQACGGFDADSDGFFTDPLLCGGPLYDCDDSNREVGHGEIYYLDCDNDRLGDLENRAYLCDAGGCGDLNNQVRGCNVVSNALDCNDRPPEGAGVGSGIPLYPDCDGDGLGDPSKTYMYCPNVEEAPETIGGCPLVMNGDDCDDNPLNLEADSAKVKRWWDCDTDGYGDDDIGVMYLCPSAASLGTTQNIKNCAMVNRGGDCNDSDITINPENGC